MDLPDLALADQPRWVDAAALTAGELTVELDDGLLYDVVVEAHPDEIVGYVFVGGGAASWSWNTDAEALLGLGRLAADGEIDAPQAQGAYRARRSSELVDVVVGLGVDAAWRDRVAAWPIVEVVGRSVSWTEQGLEQVVVLDRDLPGRGEVSRQLTSRVRALTRAGLDPRDMLAADAVRGGDPRTIVEVRGGHAWGLGTRRSSASWLTAVSDPTGAVDDVYGQVLAVHDRDDWHVLTGRPTTRPVARAVPTGATVRVLTSVDEAEKSLTVDIEARLQLTAAAPTPFVDLVVPRRGSPLDAYSDQRPHDRAATVVGPDGAVADGVPWGPHGEVAGADVLRVLLAEPVGPDRPGEVTVTWTLDRPAELAVDAQKVLFDVVPGCDTPPGPADDFQEYFERCPVKKLPQYVPLGAIHVGHGLVPSVPGAQGPFPTELVASAALPDGWSALVTGTDSDRQLTVGRAELRVETMPARDGPLGPALRVMHHREGFDPQGLVEDVLALYERVLPAFPSRELAVVQGPDHPYLQLATSTGSSRDRRAIGPEALPQGKGESPPPAITVVAPQTPLAGSGEAPVATVGGGPGLVTVNGVSTLQVSATGRRAHVDRRLLERDIAGAIAAQWWSDLPWGRRDAWLGQALPVVYRDLYAAQRWSRAQVTEWRDRGGEADARLIGDALAHRVGEARLLEGLDRLRRRGPWTVAGLQQAVEAASGQELGAFVDPWMRTGLRLQVGGEARRVDGAVHVALVADVPIGRIDVPIGVCGEREGPGECELQWVTLTDGRGTVVIERGGPVVRIEIDPRGWLPLDARRVRWE